MEAGRANLPPGVAPCAGCGAEGLRLLADLSPGGPPSLEGPPRPRLFRCRACGLVQVSPRPRPEDLRRHYQDEYLHRVETRTRLSTGKEPLFHQYLDELGRATGGRRLLDVGCGAGDFLAVAGSRGWDAVGLELHRGAARAGAERGVRIFEGGPEVLPAGRFDAITLWNVLDQMPDPAAELEAVLERLEPGGVLFVRVPNLVFHLAAWRAWRLLLPGRRPPTVFHPLVFDGPALGRFLAARGLVGVRVANSALTGSPIPGQSGLVALLLRPLARGLAALLAAVSAGRLLASPSLVAWARRP